MRRTPAGSRCRRLHAENAERVRNMESALREGPYAEHVRWRDGRHATVDELAWLHDRGLHRRGARELRPTDAVFTRTTLIAPGSWPALLAAAGTAIGACDAVLDGDTPLAYALVRPPGHHASSRTADGYCFFNNTALAAENARRRGIERRRDPRLGRPPRQRHADAVLRARRRAHRLVAHGARQLGRRAIRRPARRRRSAAAPGDGVQRQRGAAAGQRRPRLPDDVRRDRRADRDGVRPRPHHRRVRPGREPVRPEQPAVP